MMNQLIKRDLKEFYRRTVQPIIAWGFMIALSLVGILAFFFVAYNFPLLLILPLFWISAFVTLDYFLTR
jgi:hypothetical protein